MAKLPKVYHNDINKKFYNNKDYIYAENGLVKGNNKQTRNDVLQLINSLFSETGFVFNKPLLIKTKEKVYDTAIIKKDSANIYTLTEDIIRIDDILSIERK